MSLSSIQRCMKIVWVEGVVGSTEDIDRFLQNIRRLKIEKFYSKENEKCFFKNSVIE